MKKRWFEALEVISGEIDLKLVQIVGSIEAEGSLPRGGSPPFRESMTAEPSFEDFTVAEVEMLASGKNDPPPSDRSPREGANCRLQNARILLLEQFEVDLIENFRGWMLIRNGKGRC